MIRLSLLGLFSLFCAAHALTYRGADISSVPVVEATGIHYTDGGSSKAFENIVVAHGANAARVRVWTSGQYNTVFALALGKRIKAAGMTLIVDLHYSDTCTLSLVFLAIRFDRRTHSQGLTRAINQYLPLGHRRYRASTLRYTRTYWRRLTRV
jgi:hypothetical protein